MTEARLTDEALAAALAGGADARGPDCPTDDAFWQLACGALAPADNAALLDHAARCAHCTCALHVAQALRAASAERDTAPAGAAAFAGSAGRGFWGRFARGVLHPVPAAVYLVALVGALSWIARGPAGTGPVPAAAIVAPRLVRLSGDVALRGPGDAVTPRSVPLAADTPLLLELYVETPSMGRASSAPTGDNEAGPLRVFVRAENTTVAELQASSAPVEDAGVLAVLVPPGTLRAGTTYAVTVERARREIFHQTITVTMP